MFANGAKETTTTTGTGTVTLAEVPGFTRFSGAFAAGAVVAYSIESDAGREWGFGTVGAGNTLARTTVVGTLVGSTYTTASPSKVSLTGTSTVMIVGMADTQVPAIPGVLPSGVARFVVPGAFALAGGEKTLGTNYPIASCQRWDCSAPISELAVEIITAAGTGSDRIQLGLYACNPNGTPGALLARTGDIAPNSTGIKTAALISGTQRIPPGWYWWAIASNVTPKVRAYAAGSEASAVMATPMGHFSGSLTRRTNMIVCSALAGGWTALPAALSPVTYVGIHQDYTPTIAAVVTS